MREGYRFNLLAVYVDYILECYGITVRNSRMTRLGWTELNYKVARVRTYDTVYTNYTRLIVRMIDAR